jgi:hypothetical protein
MPSKPILQALCEHGRTDGLDVLVETQGAARFNSEASVALRVSNGSRRISSPSVMQARAEPAEPHPRGPSLRRPR